MSNYSNFKNERENEAVNEIQKAVLQSEEQESNQSFDTSMLFKQSITPIKQERRLELIEQAKGEVTINDFEEASRSCSSCVHVIDGKSKVDILTEGYYIAECTDVIELPDKHTFVLVFEPSDVVGQRYTGITLTLSKNISQSDALGEFIFALGLETAVANSDTSLVISDMKEFRKLVLGESFGIEVSVNSETGWLYITDFFNPVDGEWPTCPEEIIRNVG